MKKLYRSRDNRIFAGLLGGIGEYLAVDPVLIRLLFVALVIFTAIVPGLLFYIIGLFLVPSHPDIEVVSDMQGSQRAGD